MRPLSGGICLAKVALCLVRQWMGLVRRRALVMCSVRQWMWVVVNLVILLLRGPLWPPFCVSVLWYIRIEREPSRYTLTATLGRVVEWAMTRDRS